MKKVIKLYQTKIDEMIESLSEQEDDIESFMVVCKLKSGEVMTGYVDVDFNARAELIGHLQVDLIDMMVRANYVDE